MWTGAALEICMQTAKRGHVTQCLSFPLPKDSQGITPLRNILYIRIQIPQSWRNFIRLTHIHFIEIFDIQIGIKYGIDRRCYWGCPCNECKTRPSRNVKTRVSLQWVQNKVVQKCQNEGVPAMSAKQGRPEMSKRGCPCNECKTRTSRDVKTKVSLQWVQNKTVQKCQNEGVLAISAKQGRPEMSKRGCPCNEYKTRPSRNVKTRVSLR